MGLAAAMTEHWSWERIARIDRLILRLALAEMLRAHGARLGGVEAHEVPIDVVAERVVAGEVRRPAT